MTVEGDVLRTVLERGHKCTMTERDMSAANAAIEVLESQHADAVKALRTIDRFLAKTKQHRKPNWDVWEEQLQNIVDIGLGRGLDA